MPADPWEFVRDCCYSFDEHEAAHQRDPRRPFPNKLYLKVLVTVWLASKCLRVEKSRQIMVTWLLAALWLWMCLKRPGTRVAWICKKMADAHDHLKSRVWWLYQNIPVNYAKPRAEFVNGTFCVYHDETAYLSGIPSSRIEPMAAERGSGGSQEDQQRSAAAQLRSKTYTGIVWDEAAFDRGQDEIHGSALPCVDGGGYFNIVSSANGENYFCRLGHGNLDGAVVMDTTISKEELLRGVQRWERNGFVNLRVHYTADPDKDPATPAGRQWFESVRPRYNARKWQREMEINFAVPAGEPVYCELERLIQQPLAYSPKRKLFGGLDFGFTCAVAILFQVDDRVKDRPRVKCLLEVIRERWKISPFGDLLLQEIEEHFPSAQVEYFGDPAGDSQSDKGNETSIGILATKGIHVLHKPTPINLGIDMIQWLLTNGLLEIDPAGCPRLLRAILGGYANDEYGAPVKDGVFDHPADGFRYGIVNTFSLDRGTTGEVVKLVRPVMVAVDHRDHRRTKQAAGTAGRLERAAY